MQMGTAAGQDRPDHGTCAVALEGVVKSFGGGQAATEVLRGVSLSVEKGSFHAITGPSGSGKSTLLSLIGALDSPTSGRVVVEGVDLARLGGAALADFRFRHVGFVFQQYHLIPTLTALENVMVPLVPRRARFDGRARGRELLERLGLKDREKHLPSQLSGGEQQRVCLARALIASPSLLLADEPTGNLDSAAGEEVMRLMLSFCRERGATLLLVTHNERLADRADVTASLQDGRIV